MSVVLVVVPIVVLVLVAFVLRPRGLHPPGAAAPGPGTALPADAVSLRCGVTLFGRIRWLPVNATWPLCTITVSRDRIRVRMPLTGTRDFVRGHTTVRRFRRSLTLFEVSTPGTTARVRILDGARGEALLRRFGWLDEAMAGPP